MTKVLLITQYFSPDITAAAFRTSELRSFLVSNNIETDVLTTSPHKGTISLDPEGVGDQEGVFRVPILSRSNMGQYLEFLFGSLKFTSGKKKYDWVIVSSPPLSVFQIAKRFMPHSKVLLDVRDIWPDSAVAAGKISEGFFYRYFKRYERSMYQTVSSICTVSAPMAEYVQTFVPGKDVFIVYNGIPGSDISAALERKPKPVKSSSGLNIAYAGNLGLLQGLEVVPEAMKLLHDEDVSFSFIGTGAKEGYIKDASQTQPKISVSGPMKREDLLLHLYENTDALFINLARHPIMEKTIPSKLFDYLIVGKPIIAGIKGEGRQILQETGAAVFFEQDSPPSLTDAIRRMKLEYPLFAGNAASRMPEVASRFKREKQFARILERIRQ